MGSPQKLLQPFLEVAKSYSTQVQPIKVLRSNTYQVGNANVLVRVASDLGKRYFFGLNYISAEEIYNLENSYVAFICGSLDKIVFMPADVLMKILPEISHDRNGEYKINISRDLKIVMRGRGNHFDCGKYINNWDLVLKSEPGQTALVDAQESFHHVLQGRLIEIGNVRGYYTYCPNKSKTFNKRKLGDLAKIQDCPKLEFADYQSLRNIDVIWFRQISNGFYPEYAFEVELTTGIWSGFGRLASLQEYNTKLYIVSNEEKRFKQVSNSFPQLSNRYISVIPDQVSLLYSAEKNLIKLREDFNL